jgi:hypothetical protein
MTARFRSHSGQLIQRTEEPALREKFVAMMECPIRDALGNCHTFAGYILSALVRNNIHQRNDIEDALGYVYERMMMDKSFTGRPRTTLFSGIDPTKAVSPDTNPLLGRFLTYLSFAIKNIVSGRIPRLSNRARRPQGAPIDPNEIPAPVSDDEELAELVDDITTLLQKKELAYDLPLAGLFQPIMAGKRTDQQIEQFGDRATKLMRQIIKQTIREFAEQTGNFRLLYLLSQFEGFRANRPQPTRQPMQPLIAALSPKDKDFRSIVAVVAQFDRPVGMADLGRYRRRWLDYPPRTSGAPFGNRLEEVLD